MLKKIKNSINHYSRPGTFPDTFVQKFKLQIHSIYDQTEFKNEKYECQTL